MGCPCALPALQAENHVFPKVFRCFQETVRFWGPAIFLGRGPDAQNLCFSTVFGCFFSWLGVAFYFGQSLRNPMKRKHFSSYMKRYAPNTKECKGNPPSKWLSFIYSLNTKASPQGVTGFRDIDFPMMNSPRNSMYDDIFTGDTPQKWISSTISLRESPYGRIPEGFPQGCRS